VAVASSLPIASGPFRYSDITSTLPPSASELDAGWPERDATRRAPPRRDEVGPFTVSELFLPCIVLPGLTFGLLYLWPFIEQRVTGDRRAHQVLDRPRDRPGRTALGVATLTFYVVLFLAGSQDVIAQKTGWPVTDVLWTLRVAVLVVPLAAALLSHELACDLRDGSAPPAPADPSADDELAGAPLDLVEGR
jgi:quinol---cytochrome-c reductase cytochrome b subunit